MRLFLAIELPEGIRACLGKVLKDLRKMGLEASTTKEEQLHVTLLFLGDVGYEEKKGILENCRRIEFPKFEIAIRSLGFFPDERRMRVLWAGAKTAKGELEALHFEVCRALGRKPEQDFTGHVTLARIKGKRNIGELVKMKAGRQNEAFGQFMPQHFVLMESILTPHGAEYSVVERFGLK